MSKLQRKVIAIFFSLILVLVTFCSAWAAEYMLKAEYSTEAVVDNVNPNHVGNLKIKFYVENYSDTSISFFLDTGSLYFTSAGYASPSTPPHRYSLNSSRLNLPTIPPHSKIWVAFKDFNIISYDPGVAVIPIIKTEAVYGGSTGLVAGNQYYAYMNVSDMKYNDLIAIPKFDLTSDVENNSLIRNINKKIDSLMTLIKTLLLKKRW